MKAFSAGFIGFIVGKASYASVLQEKFLTERPYSELSQIIRKNRGMPEIEIPPEYQTVQTDSKYFFTIWTKTISKTLFFKVHYHHRQLLKVSFQDVKKHLLL